MHTNIIYALGNDRTNTNQKNVNILIAGYLKEFHKVPYLDHYYLVFFNDVACLKCDGRSLFADDGVFWLIDCSLDCLIFRVNQFMKDLFSWLIENKLLPNSSKTFLMIFQTGLFIIFQIFI